MIVPIASIEDLVLDVADRPPLAAQIRATVAAC